MAAVQQQALDPSPIAGLLAFRGRVPTFSDALVILEACRQGSLTMVNRRLTDLERREIACGDVFVFDEAVSGIKRWADGRLWSSSRMRDCFLIYVELGMAAGISGFNPRRVPASSPSDLLRKKVLSITTSTGQRLRLVAYSSAMDDDSDEPAPEANIQGITPRRDPRLANIVIPAGIFHSNTGPMGGLRGDADRQQAGATESSPSGSSAAAPRGRAKGRSFAAAAGRSSTSTAGNTAVLDVDHHQVANACSGVDVGGQHYDSSYYGPVGNYNNNNSNNNNNNNNRSSSGSPPLSIMSAPVPDQHTSSFNNTGRAQHQHRDQYSRSAEAATSPGRGGGGNALASVSASGLAGNDDLVDRASAPAYATVAGVYGDTSSRYLAHQYPPQYAYHHHAHHPYFGPASTVHAHQHSSMTAAGGYYDSSHHHAYDPYRQQPPLQPPQQQQRAIAAANPSELEAVAAATASTTPTSRHSDPAGSLPTSAPAAPPPAAPATHPYGPEIAHHGPYPGYPSMHPHDRRYFGRYTGAPRYHPHHHHPGAYYGVAPVPPQPAPLGPSYLASVPRSDLAAVINGSAAPGALQPAYGPPRPPPTSGLHASPQNTGAAGASSLSAPLSLSISARTTMGHALDMHERSKDMTGARVPRADSGMYIGYNGAGMYPARDHRDRPAPLAAAAAADVGYAGAATYYAPVGFAARTYREADAGATAQGGSPRGGGGSEASGRSPRGAAAMGEVGVGVGAGVV
ncbi:Gti1/Pac2 family-domain-containing protein [Catenaria anguillulae PL171]|uniref:Gti1/Pac2 family-domain-containing protein n=1 Tax=Catenaria anguillulae PL171 TaxID=765915 RepID=A0A1Y2HIQ8_9FUNG|nr:Gti1/Pac2 family-domain-containing protein [Catenaria anguillulae PL171]